MLIKEQLKNHRGQIIPLVLLMVMIPSFFVWRMLSSPNNNNHLPIILCGTIFLELCLFQGVAQSTRQFHVTQHGIFVTYLGKKTVIHNWSNFCIVEHVIYTDAHYGGNKDGILCSKIPPKYSDSYNKMAGVSQRWIHEHPGKVFAIDLSDMIPGQYEEFWTYVPDRFKHSA